MTDTPDTVTHLPQRAPPPKPHHIYGSEKYVDAHLTITGLPQTEKTCTVCLVVKAMVHEEGGGAHREWRACEGAEQVRDEIVCVGMIGVAQP